MLGFGRLTPPWVRFRCKNADSGQSAALTILQSGKNPEAVIGCNDLVAFGFMHEALDRGFKIPDDFMIAGFDNIPVAQFFNPPLTSVSMQADMQGERAFHKIINLIEQPNEEREEVVLEPLLFPRRSTRSNG